MDKINIDTLPEKLNSHEITMEEAVNIIWVELYTHPQIYGLADFDEDEKSDFLLSFRERFPLLFKTYDTNLGIFSNYIRGNIYFKKISWKKKQLQKKIKGETEASFFIEKFDEKSGMQNESQSKASEKSEELSTDELKPEFTEESECKSKIKIFTVLALALKACHDIDDEMISKISKYTGLKENSLQKIVQEMKSVELKTSKSRERLVRRRNHAFYFRRKYGLEMQNIPEAEPSYAEIRERYDFQTKNWIKSNELLAKRSKIGPTNVDIAKRLGLKPRTVGFYLFCAKKNLSKNENDEHSGQSENQDDENS